MKGYDIIATQLGLEPAESLGDRDGSQMEDVNVAIHSPAMMCPLEKAGWGAEPIYSFYSGAHFRKFDTRSNMIENHNFG